MSTPQKNYGFGDMSMGEAADHLRRLAAEVRARDLHDRAEKACPAAQQLEEMVTAHERAQPWRMSVVADPDSWDIDGE